MITMRWWILLACTVIPAFSAWEIARYYNGPPHMPPAPGGMGNGWMAPEPGPAALDPYVHDLTITGVFNAGCSQSCPLGAAELAGVSWHLKTSAPSAGSLPDPLPALEGRVCQTGTWGTIAEQCTEPFEIKEEEIDRVPPEHLVVFAQAAPTTAPPNVLAMIYIELVVGAKRAFPTQKPAMDSRANASFEIVAPLPLPPSP